MGLNLKNPIRTTLLNLGQIKMMMKGLGKETFLQDPNLLGVIQLAAVGRVRVVVDLLMMRRRVRDNWYIVSKVM